MRSTNWKNQMAAPQSLSAKEIERLENYPGAQPVNLDEVIAQSAAQAKRKRVRKRG